MDIISEVKSFAQKYMNGRDASHDMEHVLRVCRIALYIAKEECIIDPKTLQIIEIAALLHDVDDHKYVSRDEEGNVSSFLKELGSKYSIPIDVCNRILHVVRNIGFSDEMKRLAILHSISQESDGKHVDPYFLSDDTFLTPELKVVQDADRLDAIGAIGIARCLFFSASKGNRIYNIPIPELSEQREETMGNIPLKQKPSAIDHFDEKLFKLKDMMKTNTGRILAEERTKIMDFFVDNLKKEWIFPL